MNDPGEADSTDPDRARTVARLFLEEVWNQGTVERLDALFAPDVRCRLNAETMEGRGAVKDFVWQFHRAFPDLRVRAETTVAQKTRVAQGFVMSGTQDGALLEIAPTGRTVEITGTHVLELDEEGRVARYWGNFDALGLLEQLGVLGNAPRAGD